MVTTAPSAFRWCLVFACLSNSVILTIAQLDIVYVEGSTLPEIGPRITTRSDQPENSTPQHAAQRYTITAIDGVVATAAGSKSTYFTSINTAAPGAAAAEVRRRTLQTAPAASHAPNPAATAFTASVVPAMGVAPAGSKAPGRYIVLFKDDVESIDSGVERLQRHVKSRLESSAISAAGPPPSAAAAAAGTFTVASVAAGDDAPEGAPFLIKGRLGTDAGKEQQHYGIAVMSIRPSTTSVISSGGGASSSSSGGGGTTLSSSSSSSSSTGRLRGVVVEAPSGVKARALYRALMTSGDVRKVIQDRVISIAQDRCTSAKSLTSISATAPALRWAGCKMAGTKIYWFGERCGANLGKTRWLGMYAVNTTTEILVPGCLQYRKVVDSDPWNAVHLGQCGVPPTSAPNLPVSVCPDADTSGCIPASKLTMLRLTLHKPVTCNTGSSSELILQGSRCGPGLGFVQWSSIMMPDTTGCSFSRSTADSKFNNDWLGTCGVTPRNYPLPGTVCTASQSAAGINELSSGAFTEVPPPPAQQRSPPPPRPLPAPLPPAMSPPPPPLNSPPPPPPPSPPSPLLANPSPPPASPGPASNSIPAETLAANEFIPAGVQRVQAVYNSRVPDLDNAPVKGIVVAVVDTGVDASHPDLNVVGGMNFVADEPALTYADDTHGHGTHVAGTIGARNQGKGIVGVAPGIGIYALRVLKADGNGLFSDLLKAYDHLVTNGRSLGVRVVNLSLSGSGDGGDEECGYIQQLISQGMTVVTAAGNAGVSLLTEVPAACTGALAVTAVTDLDVTTNTDDAAAIWSNFLPLPDADGLSSRVIAAPGEAITSTYPLNKPGFNGYAKMSGTSMACPHVSGIAALCYSAGVCQRNAGSEITKVVNPATAWSVGNSTYGFSGDPQTNAAVDKYYGYMAWSRRFWDKTAADG